MFRHRYFMIVLVFLAIVSVSGSFLATEAKSLT